MGRDEGDCRDNGGNGGDGGDVGDVGEVQTFPGRVDTFAMTSSHRKMLPVVVTSGCR